MHLSVGRDLRGGMLGKKPPSTGGGFIRKSLSFLPIEPSCHPNPPSSPPVPLPPSYPLPLPPIHPHDEHSFQLRVRLCVRSWDVAFDSKHTARSRAPLRRVSTGLHSAPVIGETFRLSEVEAEVEVNKTPQHPSPAPARPPSHSSFPLQRFAGNVFNSTLLLLPVPYVFTRASLG